MKYFFSIFMTLVLFTLLGCSHKTPKKRELTATQYTSKARHKATMRCYTVRGKKYTPTYVKTGQTMRGISSWYGPNFHGKYTSNGEVYNMYARTAAHKTWPMDTMVEVTNLENGKKTVVRINDRGPFVKGRIIDCSYKAGKELGLDKMGIAKVSIKVVGFAGKVAKQTPKKKQVVKKRVRLSNFQLQVAVFSDYQRAKKARTKYAKAYPEYRVIIKKESARGLYKVWLMGFETEQEAKDFKMCHALDGAFIVRN
jgi:rare lipoprotein A